MPTRAYDLIKQGLAVSSGNGFGEQLEHAIAIGFDPAGQTFPIGAVDHLLEGADLEIVLDIDGQGVAHAPS